MLTGRAPALRFCVPLTCNLCADRALRIWEMEVEVERLRELLVPPDFVTLCRQKLGIRQGPASVLAALSQGGPKSRIHLLSSINLRKPEWDLPEDQIVDVYICRLRAKLPVSVEIQTITSYGYQIPDDHIDRLKALVSQ